ncbi:MAG: Mur ligase domain-containing protein, partial [Rhodospirillales bacterium]
MPARRGSRQWSRPNPRIEKNILRLTDLLPGNSTDLHGAQNDAIRITGLTADSRQVQPGFLFAALAGRRADGRLYIDEAVRRGAAVILAPAGAAPPLAADNGGHAPATFVFDDNPRRRFALMAARFYARQPRTVAAVTGTNGKTSVVWFLRQIWDALGHSAGSIGTLGVIAPGIGESGSLTTP